MQNPRRFLSFLVIAPLLALIPLRAADDLGKLIFQDDFARTEARYEKLYLGK